ncbi:MAG TPA: hypothetical protein VJ948_12530 [Acidimicrobiia bacterium]|nr:hypothetical protein [Acidimicrobiia bacterium]
MFVEYATEVTAPLGAVENNLERVRANLEEWADIAYRDGEQLTARVGPTEYIAHRVELKIGVARFQRSGLVYAVHWKAIGATVLFPVLNADLVLTNVGADRTTITLRGTYEPPLGVVGRLADRAILGRLAEATVRNWVDRLAGELNSQPQPR